MKLAIIGATGLVGKTLLTLIEERSLHIQELLLVASEGSEGQHIIFTNNIREYLDIRALPKPRILFYRQEGVCERQEFT